MRKTKFPILEAVHETAKGLHKAGVMDQVTRREFDRLCLPPVEPLQPEQIKHIRKARTAQRKLTNGRHATRTGRPSRHWWRGLPPQRQNEFQ